MRTYLDIREKWQTIEEMTGLGRANGADLHEIQKLFKNGRVIKKAMWENGCLVNYYRTPIECNGYVHPQNQFSDKAIGKLKGIYLIAKTKFEINTPAGEFHFGRRFNSVDSVIGRIQSATTEEDFVNNSWEWVWAALEDCAAADWWYTYEKEY